MVLIESPTPRVLMDPAAQLSSATRVKFVHVCIAFVPRARCTTIHGRSPLVTTPGCSRGPLKKSGLRRDSYSLLPLLPCAVLVVNVMRGDKVEVWFGPLHYRFSSYETIEGRRRSLYKGEQEQSSRKYAGRSGKDGMMMR